MSSETGGSTGGNGHSSSTGSPKGNSSEGGNGNSDHSQREGEDSARWWFENLRKQVYDLRDHFNLLEKKDGKQGGTPAENPLSKSSAPKTNDVPRQSESKYYEGRQSGSHGYHFMFERKPTPTQRLEDVIGRSFDQVKEHLTEIITAGQFPYLTRISAPGHKVRSNMLLIGPYGCGKTELMRAACADPRVIGTSASVRNALTAFNHESVNNVGRIYDAAKRLFQEEGEQKPVLLVLDEFDAWFTRGVGIYGCNDMQQIELTLSEILDGMGDYNGIITLATTNEPSAIPPRILRRFRYVDIVGDLTLEERKSILKMYLERSLPVHGEVNDKQYTAWAQQLEGAPGDVVRKVVDEIHFIYLREYLQNKRKEAGELEREIRCRIQKRGYIDYEEDSSLVRQQFMKFKRVQLEDVETALQKVLSSPATVMQINKAKKLYQDSHRLLEELAGSAPPALSLRSRPTVSDNIKSLFHKYGTRTAESKETPKTKTVEPASKSHGRPLSTPPNVWKPVVAASALIVSAGLASHFAFGALNTPSAAENQTKKAGEYCQESFRKLYAPSSNGNKVDISAVKEAAIGLVTACRDSSEISKVLAAGKEQVRDYFDFPEITFSRNGKNDPLAEKWKKSFQQKFGEKAILYSGNPDTYQWAVHMNYKPIRLDPLLHKILHQTGIPTDEEMEKSTRGWKPQLVEVGQLSQEERDRLALIPKLEQALFWAEPRALPEVKIYRALYDKQGKPVDNVAGYHSLQEPNTIYIHRNQLEDEDRLIGIYTHERGHQVTKGWDHQDSFREFFESVAQTYVNKQVLGRGIPSFAFGHLNKLKEEWDKTHGGKND